MTPTAKSRVRGRGARDSVLGFLMLCFVAWVPSCGTAGGAPYTLRTDAAAPVAPDGLRPLEGTPFDEAWMDPGFDPPSHRRVRVVVGSVVQADTGKVASRSTDLASDRYRLSDAHREQLARALADALEAAVEASETLERADSGDADGLLLEASIDPLEMLAPMRLRDREEVLVARTARLTLRAEIRDPKTRRVLMRFVDVREARGVPSTRAGLQQAGLYPVSVAGNLSDIRQASRRFADVVVRSYARIVERPPANEADARASRGRGARAPATAELHARM